MNDRTPPVWVLGRSDADIDLFEARRRAAFWRGVWIGLAASTVLVGFVVMQWVRG